MEDILRPALIVSCSLLAAAALRAESGYDAWLRYQPLEGRALQQYRDAIPAAVVARGDSAVIVSARDELIRGVRAMLGRTLRVETSAPADGAIRLETRPAPRIPADGFHLKTEGRSITVAGATDRGVLYGVFALLRRIALGEPVANLDEEESPLTNVRWVNHWDNLDGSIERGYG